MPNLIKANKEANKSIRNKWEIIEDFTDALNLKTPFKRLSQTWMYFHSILPKETKVEMNLVRTLPTS